MESFDLRGNEEHEHESSTAPELRYKEQKQSRIQAAEQRLGEYEERKQRCEREERVVDEEERSRSSMVRNLRFDEMDYPSEDSFFGNAADEARLRDLDHQL